MNSVPLTAQYNEATKNGGLFYSLIDPASTTGCTLNVNSVNFDTNDANIFGAATGPFDGSGGIYHCYGGGGATVNIHSASIKSSTAKLKGGSFYISVMNDISMLIDTATTKGSVASTIIS
jgi:hypothetical protein